MVGHGELGDGQTVVGGQRHILSRPASRVMTTPAAWVEAWRGMPSIVDGGVDQLVDLAVGIIQCFQVGRDFQARGGGSF